MTDKEGLTENDVNMIYYFHFEKGDISRWSQWEERKPVFKKYAPEIIDAIERLESAQRTLNILIRDLGETL